MSPFNQTVGCAYGLGNGGSKVICIWCGRTGLGGFVLSGTMLHISGRPGIAGVKMTAGRRFTISGYLNP